MPATGWSVAPSLLSLRTAINELEPDRLKSTDGFIGDAAHFGDVEPGEKPSGEHVPTDAQGYYRENGVVRAGDYDVRRPDGSQFGDKLVELLIADGKANDRIAYIIHKAKIYSRVRNWAPAASSGHGHWVHVSIRNNTSSRADVATVNAAAADTSPWWPDEEEVDMDWPSCVPVKMGDRLKVATPAGLQARTRPSLDEDARLVRDGKRVTVAEGYGLRVTRVAFGDGIWWAGDTFWYALTRPDGTLYWKRS